MTPRVDLDTIDVFVRVGCDHVVLNQVGRDQDFFFEMFESRIAPALRSRKAA